MPASRNSLTRRRLFPPSVPDPDVTTARTVNKGHGRLEIRQAHASDLLRTYLQNHGFVDAQQVIRIERIRRIGEQEAREYSYYLSSHARDHATAFDFLRWIRGHWGIENKLHYVRDVTFGEDACRVRKGGSAQVLAALRNTASHLLNGVDAPSKKAATRRFQVHPLEALELLKQTHCET